MLPLISRLHLTKRGAVFVYKEGFDERPDFVLEDIVVAVTPHVFFTVPQCKAILLPNCRRPVIAMKSVAGKPAFDDALMSRR